MVSVHEQPVVLLLADEAVEALALSEALAEAGYKVSGPLTTTADALISIEREPPDLAVLGVMPADGSGEAVAEVLHQRGIPFVVHSFDPPNGHVTGVKGMTWLAKPAWPWDIVATLDELSLMATTR